MSWEDWDESSVPLPAQSAKKFAAEDFPGFPTEPTKKTVKPAEEAKASPNTIEKLADAHPHFAALQKEREQQPQVKIMKRDPNASSSPSLSPKPSPASVRPSFYAFENIINYKAAIIFSSLMARKFLDDLFVELGDSCSEVMSLPFPIC